MLPPKEGYSVLVVDDDEAHCYALQKMLQHLGWSVECTFDGSGAVRRAREGHFDSILLDVHLPDFDGFEALKRIRAAAIPQPAIVFHSASGGNEASKTESEGFLTYPVEIEHIDAVLRGAIQRRRDQKHKAE